jgi:short-subunit dehydrogenase
MNFKPLNQQVIVITGASSGIGLATARAAAQRGAKLVLVSRNGNALQAIVDRITSAGGEAMHVVADVGRRADLQRAADAAIARFGGFDTWVNNAGVSLYGRMHEVSDEDHQRLFQTNFWGVVFGSLVATAHLKQHGGALINLGSVLSDSAAPLQGMYSASKHAVKGFTDALRMELEAERAPVSVTLIKPAAINTPYPQHAKNYLPQEASLPPPVYQPEEVARAILYAATHAKRDIFIGSAGRLLSIANRTFPRLMDRVGETYLTSQQTRPGAGTRAGQEGTLHRPGVGGRVHGRYPGYVMNRSLYTRASLHPLLTGAVLLTAGVAAAAILSHTHRPSS